MEYYSQYGQDKFLNEKIFKNKKNGVFIDIGAHDGITINNTYFFEKYLNWAGICIEPLPERFLELDKNRNCIKENCCISKKEEIVKFMRVEGYSEMLSGITENYDPKHLDRLKNELNNHGGRSYEIEVQSKQLNKILDEHKINKIDFCSIDTEGSELSILESIDFINFDCYMIDVENNYNDKSIRKKLEKEDYKLIHEMKCDQFYRKKQKLFYFIKY